MITYLYLAQIVVAIAVVVIMLLQVRGGGLGGIFGQPGTVFRTRRGIEKALFRLGVALAIVFIALCMFTVGYPNWFRG